MYFILIVIKKEKEERGKLNNKKQKGYCARSVFHRNARGRKWLSDPRFTIRCFTVDCIIISLYDIILPKINKEGKFSLIRATMGPLILLVASFAVHTQHVRRRMELYMAFVRKMEPNMYFINAY